MDWVFVVDRALSAGIGQEAVIFALAAIGLNIHFGYTGLLNFGQVAFLAAAAYGVGVTVVTYDLPLGLGFVVGILACVVLALLLGIPTLRLRADYLAIVTIAVSEIIRLSARSVTLRDFSGGSNGLSGFSDGFYELNPLPDGDYGVWEVTFSANRTWVLLVGWTLVAATTLLVFLLMRSPWGRVLKAIREDEEAARSLGKNVFSYKMQSLVLGGVIGGFAGFVFAIGTAAVQPDNYSPPLTFFAYAVLILGGTARVLGPVVGSMIFWFLVVGFEAFMREAVTNDLIPDALVDSNDVGFFRFMLVGLALVLLMVFRPQGLFGDRKELALDVR